MKRLLSIVMGFVVALSALQAQNSITMDNVDFVKGESAVMTVNLKNATTFSAFQMDFTLPEGVEIAKNSDKLDITLNDARKSDSHVLSYYVISSNKVRIVAYSGSNANFKGNSGALLHIGIKATGKATTYTATLDNILFTTADENEVSLANASSKVKVSYDIQALVTDASKGSISVSGEPSHGSKITITVSPNEHYELDKLMVNDQDVTAQIKNNIYTISSLTSAINAVASFKLKKYTAIFEIDGKVIEQKAIEYGTTITPPTAPAKEGHTFAGWNNLPATMPGKDITVTGIYTVNNYTVTFKIDDKVIYAESLPYGSKIIAPEAPAKEGYTFDGWGEVAATVPAKDVTYTGSYTVNKYTLTFTADGKTVQTGEVAYGTKITAPEAPAKEGYTFDGWKDVPATMPAKAVTINGTYTVNTYTVTFKIGDEVISTETLAYGSKIVAPEAPEKEGHTFAGWDEVAATVPAMDVTYTGSYTINKYTVTFKIGDEVIYSESLPYGTEITAPEAPEKEGHIFAGWGEVAATVPAMDVTYAGSYTVNYYTVTFKIDGEVIYSESLPYGSPIVAPEAPAVEGKVFSGWGKVAATVPAMDVTYEGSYINNPYEITYYVDGVEYYRGLIEFGATIALIDEPTKEGHTFSGWSEVPATMPAEEVKVYGTFSVNVYNVYYYVGEELVHTAEVAYGNAIPEYIYKTTTEGDVFVGWIGETYETMPAHDVTYTANIESSINPLLINNGQLTIYDLTGRKVTDTENLKGGIYIVNGRKVVIK